MVNSEEYTDGARNKVQAFTLISLPFAFFLDLALHTKEE